MTVATTTPLGTPIPDVPHAVSVSLPTWADVVGYEEGDPRVVGALRAGYPRFVFHPAVKALMGRVEEEHAGAGERALVLPSPRVAARAIAHLTRNGVPAREVACPGFAAVLVSGAGFPVARQYWQHAGEIVSSRRAEALLKGEGDAPHADAVRRALRERVAGLAGVGAGDVSVHPSGMAAIAAALRLAQALHPGRPTAQVGFPYIDTLKLQERLGAGARFYPHATSEDLDALEQELATGKLAAVFLELPGNPLMASPDLARISRAARAAGVPLVVDDSVGSFFHHDFRPYADLLVSSLTKYFSGNGDALAGALALVPSSPLYERLSGLVDPEELLFGEDAATVLAGARDFEARMATIAATTEQLARALAAHPAVRRVYHPRFDTPDHYDLARRAGGGHGGMFSLLLPDEPCAQRFYDRLEVDKGPSFGIRRTLACPYTLLAHYTELDWAAACGVERHLVRVSVGLEPFEDLLGRFDAALQAATRADTGPDLATFAGPSRAP